MTTARPRSATLSAGSPRWAGAALATAAIRHTPSSQRPVSDIDSSTPLDRPRDSRVADAAAQRTFSLSVPASYDHLHLLRP
jgi:hypothetical protein